MIINKKDNMDPVEVHLVKNKIEQWFDKYASDYLEAHAHDQSQEAEEGSR